MKPNLRNMPPAMVTSEKTIRCWAFSQQDIQQFCFFLEREQDSFLEEVVPSTNTITVFYRKKLVNPSQLLDELHMKWLERTDSEVLVQTRTIVVPVCYDERFGEDMPRIMAYTGLTREEVIE